MLDHCVVLFAVGLAFAQVFATPSNQDQLNGWYPCSNYTISEPSNTRDAECASYMASLCYPGICNASDIADPTISIFVKRFLATTGDPQNATNVWLLQGGPGHSSTGMEPLMISLQTRLEGMVNVYTMDHRGTGRSTRLDCATAQATTPGSPSGVNVNPSEVSACAEDLQFQFGDLASFSMTTAATDIATFISKYTNGKDTIVYGVSYGTALVERLMHLNPPTVIGYVLDSIATASGASNFPFISMWDTDFGEVGETFLELCKEDKECMSHFESGDLVSTLQGVIEKVDKEPNSTCSQVLISKDGSGNEPPSFYLRRALGVLVADTNLRTLIPPIIYRLRRCGSGDIDVLTRFVSSLEILLKDSAVDNPLNSMLLYNLIVYSEMWETPTPSNEILKSRFTNMKVTDGGFTEGEGSVYELNSQYCAFSKEKSPTCDEFNVGNYDANPILYKRDEYWNKSATIPSHASVLLMSGKLDPLTPPKYAKYLLDVLNGDNKELVTFNYTGHATMMSTPLVEGDPISKHCGLRIIASYVKNGGNLSSLDKSCMNEMPGFNLTIPTGYLHYYLGTEDAYNGAYNTSLDVQN